MLRHELDSDYQECYEYHGNTVIEVTRKLTGDKIKRDWILFDSVEEAQEFFNDYCTVYEGTAVSKNWTMC